MIAGKHLNEKLIAKLEISIKDAVQGKLENIDHRIKMKRIYQNLLHVAEAAQYN